ncbi:3231_t:CDS:2 [Ambispora gerdemannii]|uniref:3231_t:CDS:1 n=1 Tax=Ambispora gerdemannii TaxID=144530 RepID=A0A9N9FA66_9GLOM|nr:3231_t:CDS:2 [Ambispora gerdemannii]
MDECEKKIKIEVKQEPSDSLQITDEESKTSNSKKRGSKCKPRESLPQKNTSKKIKTTTSDITTGSSSATTSTFTSPSKESSTCKTGRKPSSAWTSEQDNQLIDAVLSHLVEVPWAAIASEKFPERGRGGCYNRWQTLKKRMYVANSDNVRN